MGYYNPLFERSALGKYNPDTSFVSIKNGTDAYLLEDEVNELQWMQSEARAAIVRQTTDSGYLYVNDASNQNLLGSIQLFSNTYLNAFGVNKSPVILNGYMVNIQGDDNRCTIVLPDPPTQGTRHDFVFLEYWFREVKPYEQIHKYGGIDNSILSYDILDTRLNAPTSYRVQLQWKIRVASGIDYATYLNGFTNHFNGNSNPTIHPLNYNNSPDTQSSFSVLDTDQYIFRAGANDADSKLRLGSIDGYHYAMPLFIVKRLNSSGYDPRYNPEGGVEWVDSNSLASRPDEHFANIIYEDQIIGLRNLAQIGKFQNDVIYAKLSDVNVNYEMLLQAIFDLQTLTIEFNDFKNYINNVKMPDIDSRLLQLEQLLAAQVAALQAQIDSIIARLNSLDIDIADIKYQILVINMLIENHNRRLAQIEDILASLGYLSTTQSIKKYNLPVIFIINTSPGVVAAKDSHGNTIYIQGELAINATESTGINSYSVITSLYYSANTNTHNGDLGDFWIEKTDYIYVYRNTGAIGRELDFMTLLIDNVVTFSGSSVFGGIDGTQIDRVLADTDFIYIMPTFNANAKYGEWYVDKNATGFLVRNTGESRDSFDWVIIDTTQLINYEFKDMALNGMDGIQTVGAYGNKDEYHVMITTPFWTGVVNPGSIGEVSYSKTDNAAIIYNTGTTVGTVKALILKQV